MLRRRHQDQQARDDFTQWQKDRERADPRLRKKCEWGQRNRKLRAARRFDQTRIKEDAREDHAECHDGPFHAATSRWIDTTTRHAISTL